MKNHLFGIGLALAGSLALVTPADAGQAYGVTFSCVVSNSVPNCAGTLRAARLSAGTSDYATFTLLQSGTLTFTARYGASAFSCSFDSASSAALGAAAVGADFNTYFNLKIDSNGKCVNAYLQNLSALQHLDRP